MSGKKTVNQKENYTILFQAIDKITDSDEFDLYITLFTNIDFTLADFEMMKHIIQGLHPEGMMKETGLTRTTIDNRSLNLYNKIGLDNYDIRRPRETILILLLIKYFKYKFEGII